MGRRVSDNSRGANATAACALALATSVTGCSFLFSEGAPADHARRATFSCGTSHAPPVLDTVFAGVLAYGAANTASSRASEIAKVDPAMQADKRREIDLAIGVSALLATLDAASAVYGYHAVSSCRGAEEARAVALARARVLPPPYGVGPYGEPPRFWPPPSSFAPPPQQPPAFDAPPPVAPTTEPPAPPASPPASR
jgi:hypothetical protein